MNRITDVIKQVINSSDVVAVAIGFLLIISAIAIGVFKQYWLIGGINTTPETELEKIDLKYTRKYFGIFTGIFGIAYFLSPFIFRYLNIMEYYTTFLVIAPFAFILYGHFNKSRIFKRK